MTASVIDTGAETNRYFLSLTADTTGAKDIALRTVPDDELTNTLSVTRPGANAMLKVNGQFVSSSDNLIFWRHSRRHDATQRHRRGADHQLQHRPEPVAGGFPP